MCGIVATNIPEFFDLAAPLAAMADRGPDDLVQRNLGWATIGISRLAITDPKHGTQPLRSSQNDVDLVFNGAVYNMDELITYSNAQLNTKNDAEILLSLYEKDGLNLATRIDGMFGAILADSRTKTLIGVVDPVGIKPLYAAQNENGWFFASVLQAFPESLRPIAARIPPGAVWTTQPSYQFYPRYGSKLCNGPEALFEVIRTSVEQQIPSEVSWGCLLSGGVDSSMVSAIAAQVHGKVETFTSGFADSEDRIAAAKLADQLAFEHHEAILQEDELPGLIESVITASASPDPYITLSGIGTFAAAKCAASYGKKVVLSGEGADELFAGYEEYLSEPASSLNMRLIHDQNDLAATECLRLDRCTMATSVEARVPFLAPAVVECANALAPSLKRESVGDFVIQKVILRQAAERVLPSWVAMRTKVPFFRGSGVSDAVERIATKLYSRREVSALQAKNQGFEINNAIEAWIFSVWKKKYPELAESEKDMVRRGLYRRRYSIYQPRYTRLNEIL